MNFIEESEIVALGEKSPMLNWIVKQFDFYKRLIFLEIWKNVMVMCFFLKSFSFGLSINSVDCFDLWHIFPKKNSQIFFHESWSLSVKIPLI